MTMTNFILNFCDKHHSALKKYAFYLACTGILILYIFNFVKWLVNGG